MILQINYDHSPILKMISLWVFMYRNVLQFLTSDLRENSTVSVGASHKT